MARWPTSVQLNVFAYDDFFYGDIDGDGVIDRIPPNSPGTELYLVSHKARSDASGFSSQLSQYVCSTSISISLIVIISLYH